jgi:hypothetical protein
LQRITLLLSLTQVIHGSQASLTTNAYFNGVTDNGLKPLIFLKTQLNQFNYGRIMLPKVFEIQALKNEVVERKMVASGVSWQC